MISLILRVKVGSVWADPSWVSSLWRTSCWVMVDPPRGWPRSASRPETRMPSGSNPELSQNVLSSTAVVASTSWGGIWLKVRTVRFSVPNVASWVVPSRA